MLFLINIKENVLDLDIGLKFSSTILKEWVPLTWYNNNEPPNMFVPSTSVLFLTESISYVLKV